MRGEMPILLTMPIRFARRPRGRRRRPRRAALLPAILLALGIALVVLVL
jgi:hypothetical protein